MNEAQNEKTVHERLIEQKPGLLTALVPSDGVEQKRAFMAGEVRNPHHEYARLNQDYTGILQEIIATGGASIDEIGSTSKFAPAYEECVESFADTIDLMSLMYRYNLATEQSDRTKLCDEIMKINVELFGAPVEKDYHHVLALRLDAIDRKSLTGRALAMYQEVLESLPVADNLVDPDAYDPQSETVEWVQDIVSEIYGRMLSHVEDGETYDPERLRDLFAEVINEEFGEAADGWRVVLEKAASVTVKAEEKKIIIPEGRATVNSEKAKDLIVHEIGVHMLRALYGYDSDVAPLATGLVGAGDSEEGLATAVQQARRGQYKEAGLPLYLVSGIAYFEHADFRHTYELMWRFGALAMVKEGDVSDAQIDKAQDKAYSLCMRVFRGTDEVPIFKDLQYYNGSKAVWQKLESIRGDEMQFQLMLMGKTDVTNRSHDRIVLESRSS